MDYFTQAESHLIESPQQTVESHLIESHFVESQQATESHVSLFAVLLPQEAKEIAANAANTNNKLFILFTF